MGGKNGQQGTANGSGSFDRKGQRMTSCGGPVRDQEDHCTLLQKTSSLYHADDAWVRRRFSGAFIFSQMLGADREWRASQPVPHHHTGTGPETDPPSHGTEVLRSTRFILTCPVPLPLLDRHSSGDTATNRHRS